MTRRSFKMTQNAFDRMSRSLPVALGALEDSKLENIFFLNPLVCPGSPEAEAGVSGVRQAVLRPQAAHQAGA